ncbi:hypothetical protein GCM10007877_22170 [Marinibactrum halimedae]|uniref:DNA-directed DNA polymerase n=1 Tax=Marinibactrum halimedae TaxID=1444977 RepID=A0AA37T9N2_9GAMM|nr:hypothetical protein GCM10007877_22170 [Marinibactrum halimedae]
MPKVSEKARVDDEPIERHLALPYPWQQSFWSRLVDQYHGGKTPHALLLSGPVGIGKRQLALSFSHLLLCASPKDGQACGECKSCLLNQAHTHPDLNIAEPEPGAKTIKVDQVRAVIDFLGNTAQQGGRKVVLLGPVEAMQEGASNALLKSLEEPAGQTHLLLYTHQLSLVLPTIRSRCQRVDLPVPSTALTQPWLETMVGEEAAELLEAASFSPLEALALATGERQQEQQDVMQYLRTAVLEGASSIMVAEKLMKFEPLLVIEEVIRVLQLAIKDAVLSESSVVESSVVESSVVESSVVASERGTLAQRGTIAQGNTLNIRYLIASSIQSAGSQPLYRFLDKLVVNKRALLSGANPNKQLLIEELFMDLSAAQRLALKKQTQIASIAGNLE